MRKIIVIALTIAAILIIGWFYKAFKTVPTLPAFENDLTNEQGQTVKISDYKGKYVLISYFQTWCGTCIQEIPSIYALQTKIGKDKLQVIMISDEGFDKIKYFKEKHCQTLDCYRSNKPLNKLNIRVFPTTYLLDKNGLVVMSKLNAYNWSSDEVFTILNEH